MPYNLPQVQAPRMIDAFEKGRRISLADYAREQKENEALMQDASQAAAWALTQPNPEMAFDQAVSFEEGNNANWGKLRGADRNRLSYLASSTMTPADIKALQQQQNIESAVSLLPEPEQAAAVALAKLSMPKFSDYYSKKMLPPLKTVEDDLKKAKNVRDREEKLRKEHSKESKVFTETKQAYTRMMASEDTSAGDMSLVFQYMKMLDPGSTVREGEFATAEQVGGAAERYVNLYNKVLHGDRLTPAQRAQFMAEAGSIYEGLLNTQNVRDQEYRRLAEDYGINPQNVVLKRAEIPKKGSTFKTKSGIEMKVK